MRRIHAPRPSHRVALGLALALSITLGSMLVAPAFAADDPRLPVSAAMRQALQRWKSDPEAGAGEDAADKSA